MKRMRPLLLPLLLAAFACLLVSCLPTPHEHSFRETSRTFTCTEAGVINYACDCGETKQETAEATGHTVKKTSQTAPTCTQTGSITYTCSCGAAITETLAKLPHTFTETRREPTCTAEGAVIQTCACGEQVETPIEKRDHTLTETRREPTCTEEGLLTEHCEDCDYCTEEPLAALGHSDHILVRYPADCLDPQTDLYACTRCRRYREESTGEPLGHHYDEGFSADLSYLQPCTREGCSHARWQAEMLANGETFLASIAYTGLPEELTEKIDKAYARIGFILEDVGAYDADRHTYTAGSALDSLNTALESYFESYELCYDEVYDLYQYAYVQKDLTPRDTALTEQYLAVAEYQTQMYGNYAGLWQRIYDSALREYFYAAADGWTAESIAETLASYNGFSDPEYVTFKNRNTEIETILLAMSEEELYAGQALLSLYAEFVANNNRIAAILGGQNPDGSDVYGNYMEYAYVENDRDYTPTDAALLYDRIVAAIVPLYRQYIERITALESTVDTWSYEQITTYLDLVDRFTENVRANGAVNEFLKEIVISYGGVSTTYYDHLQAMMQTGNLLLGEYDGAYSWVLDGVDTPIIVLGSEYQSNQTFVHEFGHYVNFCYASGSSAPLDLAETHSQGLEMLYLTFLETLLDGEDAIVYEYLYVDSILNCFATILNTVSIDRFERAVYSNAYVGINDTLLMQDGAITPDEYDLLYDSIREELGLGPTEYRYWRPVTIRSPGYYVSYAVSMLGSMQMLSEPEEFDARVGCYTKLISYLADPAAAELSGYGEILEYAGLYSHDSEELFAYLTALLTLAEAN